MFTGITPVISSADWAVCHQETVIADPSDEGVDGYPSFRAPHELAAAERDAGWDACSTASNHSTDHGQSGIEDTLDALDSAGIQHTGSYRSRQEAARDTIYTVKGVKVGHIAVTYGLNNGEPENLWSVDQIDVAAIQARASRMKDHGVDIVVVSVHAGIEQQQQPSGEQVTVGAQLLQDPAIDLIVGAHAHVVQPITRIADGRWIIYGLGNFLAMQSASASASDDQAGPNRDGIIVLPTFTRDRQGTYRVSQMGFVPTFVSLDGHRVQLAPQRSRARVTDIVSSTGSDLVDLTDNFR